MNDQPDILLSVRALRISFPSPDRAVFPVDGIDFDIRQGRTLCLVGESGSGKSLTALSLLGLIDKPGIVDPGSQIRLHGRDLNGLGEAVLETVRGREIAMIFQEPMTALNPLMPVGEQIAESVRHHEKLGRRVAAARAVDMLRQVGIPSPDSRAKDYPHQLSGGMRQRVMIALALVCRPQLLIADEPTTALDVTIQAQILALLKDLSRRHDMAVLLITHDLGVVAEMADDVAVMYAGRIVEAGPMANVLGAPQHPYTAALLRASPEVGMPRDQPLLVIPGMVPDANAHLPGCRFAPRCAYAVSACLQGDPPTQVTGGTEVACYRPGIAMSQTGGLAA